MQTEKSRLLSSAAKWVGGGVALAVILYPLGVFYGAPLLIYGLILGGRGLLAAAISTGDEQRAIDATASLPYRHFHGGSGIGIDPQKREVHLYSQPHYRVYPYSSIRRWERNLVDAGTVVNGGAQGLALNLQGAIKAAGETGFYVDVKDVDHPRWRIAFSQSQLKKELPRWMEIFNQQINES